MTIKCDSNSKHFNIKLYNPRSCRNYHFVLRCTKGGYLEGQVFKFLVDVLKFFEVELLRLKEEIGNQITPGKFLPGH